MGSSASRVTAFEHLSGLRPFHPAAVQLMSISSESDSAIEDFERVFKSDPALTADLLLMANSAGFGMRMRVTTIRHALSLLGLERVRGLAVNIMLAGYLRAQPMGHVRAIWLHSVATAVAAEALGEIYGLSGMYTLGLMHDLGRLALLSNRGTRYADALAAEVADIEEAIELETSVCGMNHCDAGALLASTWGFSQVFQVCMLDHHGTRRSRPAANPIELIRAACSMADCLGYPEVKWKERQSPVAMPQGVVESPHLAPERMLRLIHEQAAILVS